ncbi:hypothetical protein TPE_0276 [Treponema pedis str. T A4]|uniref:Uncharacterized protein n=1 Tax=Treponema pedis str. T A4 TaxID=1291379 RepID=S5ZJP5_9SPIR|nr:hypothetical protein TPE_0276 [Treponema pedis str. T A4]
MLKFSPFVLLSELLLKRQIVILYVKIALKGNPSPRRYLKKKR